jgi:hypothetical protein
MTLTFICSFPHSQVKCNRLCGKELSCGHTCRERCSAGVPCSCDCRAVKAPVKEENKPSSAPVKAPAKQQDDAKHAKFVQSYKDFANGGAKKHDALLVEKATAMAAEEMQKLLDQEALKDLFGDDSAIKPKPVAAVTQSVQGKGATRRYVEYFNPDTSPKKGDTNTPAVVNLIDSE